MICRVCGAQTTLFQQVDWVRTEDRVLSERAFTVDTVTVDVYECAVCGHIQTENLLPADFYDTNDSGVQGYGQHIHALDTFEEKAQKLRRHTGGRCPYRDWFGIRGFSINGWEILCALHGR